MGDPLYMEQVEFGIYFSVKNIQNATHMSSFYNADKKSLQTLPFNNPV